MNDEAGLQLTNSAIRSLSLDKDNQMLWVVLDDGKLSLVTL